MASETPQKLEVVFDNRLYDLTKFAKRHPGGDMILRNYQGCDATDYFYAIHSNDARKMLKNMPSTEVPDKDKIPESDYMKLMYKLEKTNLFKSDYVLEAIQISHTIALFILATYYAHTYPLLAAFCLGVGTLVGGWIGHQCDHQRNNIMRDINLVYVPACIGLSNKWWSEKHNLHHLTTNEIDADSDIQLFPFIYLWAPKKSEDAWNRSIQHIYFSALYSILHLKWQIDGIIYSTKHRIYKEMIGHVIHWVWYFYLPWQVWVLGVLMSGTIAAWVVTASHQAEQKLEGKREFIGEKPAESRSKYQIHDYFTHQLVTTRNIDLKSRLLNYMCGGMQYQIEHHVFPRIPLYKLSEVKPIVKDYCKEHGIEYMEESFWDIQKRNYQNVENFAKVKV